MAGPGPVMFNPEEYKQALADPNELKNFVGTAIYHTIEKVDPADAGKITGMLLERGDFNEIHGRYLQDPGFFWQ